MEEVDNSIFQGRLLHVMPARHKYQSDKREYVAFAIKVSWFTASIIYYDLELYSLLFYLLDRFGNSTVRGPKTLKQRREEERKASEASGNTKAWNSLFMRPDTVC